MLIPSRIFIILTSVLAGILMIGTLKNVKDLLILIKILILFVFVFKKSVIVHSWILSHIPIHFSIIIEQYWNIQTWKSLECVILYIGIHNSYQFTHDNFKYRYILSVNISKYNILLECQMFIRKHLHSQQKKGWTWNNFLL